MSSLLQISLGLGSVDLIFFWRFFFSSVSREKVRKEKMMRRQQQQDQQSRVFYELSALVLNLLRSPPTPIQFSDHSSSSSRRPPPPATTTTQISPAGFASLMLGISMALMLCGSVTFFIGFLLMPWVLGLVMVFYVAGVVSSLSVLGKSILCYASPPPTSPRKEIPGKYGCFGF